MIIMYVVATYDKIRGTWVGQSIPLATIKDAREVRVCFLNYNDDVKPEDVDIVQVGMPVIGKVDLENDRIMPVS